MRRGERTFVIDIAVTSRDPDKAARIANALANAYLDDQAAVRAEAARRATGALTGRLHELRNRLRAAEEKAERYKEANNLVGVGGRTIGEEQLALNNAQLVAARTKVSEAQAKYEQSRAARASSIEAGAIPEAVASNTMTALRAQLGAALNKEADLLATLGARHPALASAQLQVRDARRQINEELARITRAAKIEYDRAVDAERQIAARVEELKKQQYAAGRASVELRELEREIESSRAVYDAFLRRARETGEQSGIDTTNARVIGEAMPPLEKSGISRRNLALLGALAGGGVGAVAAIVLALFAIPLPAREPPPREVGSPRRWIFWRRRSETVTVAEAPPAPEPPPPVAAPAAAEPPPSLSAADGNGWRRFVPLPGGRAPPPVEPAPSPTAPVLGTLPMVRNRRWRLGDRELTSVFQAKAHLVDTLDKPQARFAQAIRDIGATLARQEGRHRHILIAGLRREAGASTLALNLALDAALAGQPAMLVDAGLGSNSLTAVFAPEAQSGLHEVVSGSASLVRAALQDEGTGLFFLPRKGRTDRVTAEQIAGSFFTAVRRFSPILIDGAALGSDPLTHHFAEAVDDIVLVIRDSALHPADIAQAQRLLGGNAAKLRGFVLNAA